jgi:hypothetical protein
MNKQEQEMIDSKNRGVRVMSEWCIQNVEDTSSLPQEIKDLKNAANYAALLGIFQGIPVVQTTHAMAMIIEAAYNFGKAQPK